MSRIDRVQFNIRSAFARERARELARRTGMTATQIVEDALRGYVPPGAVADIAGLVRRDAILVMPAGSVKISTAEAQGALDAVRERDVED